MARYIDADMFKRKLADKDIFFPALYENELNETPTADVEEVKHGCWEQGVIYICSVCGKPAPDEKNKSEKYSCWFSPYCPHYSAKMDGGKAE